MTDWLSSSTTFWQTVSKYGFRHVIFNVNNQPNKPAIFSFSDEIPGLLISDNREAYVLRLSFDRNILQFKLEGEDGKTLRINDISNTKELYKYAKRPILSIGKLKQCIDFKINRIIISLKQSNNIDLVYTVSDEGFLPGDSESVSALIKKADVGDTVSQIFLYDYYYSGEFDDKNTPEALKWLKKAALKDHIESQLTLGHWYRSGLNVKQDLKESEYWYSKAAFAGDSGAQLCLSQISVSETESRAWHQIGSSKPLATFLFSGKFAELSLSMVAADYFLGKTFEPVKPLLNVRNSMIKELVNQRVSKLRPQIKHTIKNQINTISDWMFRPHDVPGTK